MKHEVGTKARVKKKRGGTHWAASAFQHVTFLSTSGYNTHDTHCRIAITNFHTHTHTRDLKLSIIAYRMSRHICEHKHQKTHWNKGSYFPHHTQTHKQHVRWNTHYLLSFLSCQASLHKRGSGATVGWLTVFRAVPLFWWLSMAACSHVLPGKPDLNIYEWLTQRNRK